MDIIIRPDVLLLRRYGYTITDNDGALKLSFDKLLENEYDTLFKNFSAIIERFKLANYHDTILYVVFEEDQVAYDRLNHFLNIQSYMLKDGIVIKDLEHKIFPNKQIAADMAKILDFHQHKSGNITLRASFSIATEKVEIKSEVLSKWILDSIVEKIIKLDFPFGVWGEEIIKSFGSEIPAVINVNKKRKPQINISKILDYETLKQFTQPKLTAPSILRTSIFTDFMLKLWIFIRNETPMKDFTETDFPNSQMIFLWEIANLFGWVKPLEKKNMKAKVIRMLFINRRTTQQSQG